MSLNTQKSSNFDTLLNTFLIMVFITLVSVTVIIRIRTLNVPIDRDVGEYAYAGQLMLQGVPPYLSAYNMKMPGIYAAYAIILACFGQTTSGIHTAILLINTATILLLFFLTKKLFGPIAGVACAVFFAITSISNPVQATANAENFVVLPAIAGIILLMNFADSKRYLSLVTAGLLLGIAFMMKQHGAGFILFGLFFLLWKQISQKPLNWRRLISVILVYSLAMLLPFLITCLILWYCGAFEKFWFWTFKYAHQYISLLTLETGLRSLKYVLGLLVPSALFIWLSALLGLLSIIWNREIRRHSAFLVGFLICSFLSLCPGFYFRNHYFVLFMPALAIMAAAGVIAIRDLLGLGIKSTAQTSFISILIVLAIWLQSFYSQKSYLMESDPVKVSRINFHIEPFPESLPIADYIKNHSSSTDKIVVLGSEPQIYFYSQRRSATSYIYVFPLMEQQSYAADMQREMISQIEANKPKFIVFVKFYSSWGIQQESEKILFDWIPSYLSSYYQLVGLAEALTEDETLYHWDSSDTPSKEDGWVMIWKRND